MAALIDAGNWIVFGRDAEESRPNT